MKKITICVFLSLVLLLICIKARFVSGGVDNRPAIKKANGLMSVEKQAFLSFFLPFVYAQDSLGKEALDAVLRCKQRLQVLLIDMKKGIIGENKNGLLEIKKIKFAYKALADLVKYENEDRLIIYNEIAKRDNLSLEEVEASQAKTLQDKAPHGTPIEVYNDSKQDFEWKIK